MGKSDTEKKIIVSGGFDPIHAGHIAMLRAAAKLGRLTVIINSDEFLIRKKGFRLIPYESREAVIKHLVGVAEVVKCIDRDQTVAETIRQVKPDVFVKSGDRFLDTLPENERRVCAELGVEIVYIETEHGKSCHSTKFVMDVLERLR